MSGSKTRGDEGGGCGDGELESEEEEEGKEEFG